MCAAKIHDLQERIDKEALKRELGTGKAIRVRAADVEVREIEHLWPGVLYIGKPSLLVGDPGLGKSLLTADIAARVSTGRAWPLGAPNECAGDVVMCSAEDDPSDTIVPRLIAAGADLKRIEFFDAVRVYDEDSGQRVVSLTLDKHLDALEHIAIEKAGKLRLLIVDPVAAFLGDTDSHKNAEIRSLLRALAGLASTHRFAALVISHLNKGAEASAVYRISGSLAFVAAARAAYAVVRDPGDPLRRMVLPVKNNLASDLGGFSYTIAVADNDAPYVQWGDESVTEQTADEILGNAPTHATTRAVAERVQVVAEWLKEQLAVEPQASADIYNRAEREDFSDRDVKRAMKQLGIKSRVMGFQGKWHMELPKPRK